MAEYLAPGVYLEEIAASPQRIEGVRTGTTGMVGVTECGPDGIALITSFAEFASEFNATLPEPAAALRDKWALDLDEGGHWWHFPLAVKGFFDNGGQRLFVKRINRDDLSALSVDDFVAGIQTLREVDEVALCLAPGLWSTKIHDALINLCETNRDCFAILDAPDGLDITGVRSFRQRFNTAFASLYYPWLEVADPVTSGEVQLAPSGHIAGIYARVDLERGVHRGPANETIRGITKIARDVTGVEQAVLNPEGINALRFFPGRGNLVWGGRTLSSDSDWKYVNVRRLLIFLEDSIAKGTQWAIFEPNNERLWTNVRQTVADFLSNLWRQGVFSGNKAEEAFFVKCDRTTMTQDDLDQGRLICLIGVAAVKPAEFVIFRIGQWTANRRV
jgi:phage tail sheath protein FI